MTTRYVIRTLISHQYLDVMPTEWTFTDRRYRATEFATKKEARAFMDDDRFGFPFSLASRSIADCACILRRLK